MSYHVFHAAEEASKRKPTNSRLLALEELENIINDCKKHYHRDYLFMPLIKKAEMII